MKRVDLNMVEHCRKLRTSCPPTQPNVTEDCVFYSDGEPIGFYLRQAPSRMASLLAIANNEFISSRVPKTKMSRGPQGTNKIRRERKGAGEDIEQLSCILGSVPKDPIMRRDYPKTSSVHLVSSARVYSKAMLLLAEASASLIKEILPDQHKTQKGLIETTPEKYRFGSLFTSSIANHNISAPYHRDTKNIVGCVNMILTKRLNTKGGNLNIPDYGATVDQCDGSVLVYPAWKNMHGVTPIVETHDKAYRNSFVFYPLKGVR